MSASPKYAALVAVGPGPAEVDRIADLVDSIAAHEYGPCYFVMVDDARSPRGLVQQVRFPINVAPVSIWHDRSAQRTAYTRGKGICSVIMTGLQWIAQHADDARFVLKLDTDALVIAPFASRLHDRLARTPDVGMIGAHTLTPNGTPRDISRAARIMKNLHRPAIPWHRPRMAYRMLRDCVTGGSLKLIRSALSDARRNGYQYGEHCLGGAYALSNEFLRRMWAGGHLAEPQQWLNIDSPEDVMIGMYTAACGLKMANFVGPGEVFGVRHEGLPFSPQECSSRGYGIIHAIKNDKQFSERQIRAWFAQNRRARRSVAA